LLQLRPFPSSTAHFWQPTTEPTNSKSFVIFVVLRRHDAKERRLCRLATVSFSATCVISTGRLPVAPLFIPHGFTSLFNDICHRPIGLPPVIRRQFHVCVCVCVSTEKENCCGLHSLSCSCPPLKQEREREREREREIKGCGSASYNRNLFNMIYRVAQKKVSHHQFFKKSH